MHGKGEYHWADGKVYIGNYYNDQRHGEGEFSWPNGERFIGKWTYGK